MSLPSGDAEVPNLIAVTGELTGGAVGTRV
jgi:hypothetical protein